MITRVAIICRRSANENGDYDDYWGLYVDHEMIIMMITILFVSFCKSFNDLGCLWDKAGDGDGDSEENDDSAKTRIFDIYDTHAEMK